MQRVSEAVIRHDVWLFVIVHCKRKYPWLLDSREYKYWY